MKKILLVILMFTVGSLMAKTKELRDSILSGKDPAAQDWVLAFKSGKVNIRDLRDDHIGLLYDAIDNDCAGIATMLIGYGADVNHATKDKTTSLHLAASRGKLDLIRNLIEQGAKCSAVNAENKTPLQVAKDFGQRDAAELLQTLCPTPPPPPPPSPPPSNGLLAAWNRAGGTYADATSQAGRYTVLNGVVTDTLTQIQWEQTAGTDTMVWSSVASYCSGRTTGGLTGWRAPNIVELGTLVDYTASKPYMNATAFPGAPSSNFWSASSVIRNSAQSWHLNLANHGQSLYQTTSTSTPVRCVRSVYSLPPSSRYTVGTGASTGTVTDQVTGLIWQKVAPRGTYTQANAASYCNNLNLAGLSSDWRLPSIENCKRSLITTPAMAL